MSAGEGGGMSRCGQGEGSWFLLYFLRTSFMDEPSVSFTPTTNCTEKVFKKFLTCTLTEHLHMWTKQTQMSTQTFWGSRRGLGMESAGQLWCTDLPLEGPRSLYRQRTATNTVQMQVKHKRTGTSSTMYCSLIAAESDSMTCCWNHSSNYMWTVHLKKTAPYQKKHPLTPRVLTYSISLTTINNYRLHKKYTNDY